MKILSLLLFISLSIACSKGFQSSSKIKKSEAPPSLTPTDITCDNLDGSFATPQQICSLTERLIPNRCVELNGDIACEGEGPCSICQSSNWTPPEPPEEPPIKEPPVISPPEDPLPIPPTGGNISCSGMAGRFKTAMQICTYAELVKNGSCIRLDDKPICTGFGPCTVCKTDGYVPTPTPTPTGTPIPTPTPTRTPTPTPTPYPWPTPNPGSPGPGEPPKKPAPEKNVEEAPTTPKKPGNKFEVVASLGRQDGVLISSNKPYEHNWELYLTINPNLCFTKSYPLPLPEGVERISFGRSFYDNFTHYLDTLSPDGVHLCYILTGRGVVEASTWGYRQPEQNLPKASEPDKNNPDYKMTASTDITSGIEIIMDPPFLEDLSELYVSPDVPPEKDLCPKKGDSFATPDPELRYLKVMNRYFNGRYFFDKRAPLAIDLCYFVVSKRTNIVINRAVGFRQISDDEEFANNKKGVRD